MINNLIEYSFGFNGYINNVIGIHENINNNSINETTYTNKNKAKINKYITLPYQMNVSK